jgi:hypothetical protein
LIDADEHVRSARVGGQEGLNLRIEADDAPVRAR